MQLLGPPLHGGTRCQCRLQGACTQVFREVGGHQYVSGGFRPPNLTARWVASTGQRGDLGFTLSQDYAYTRTTFMVALGMMDADGNEFSLAPAQSMVARVSPIPLSQDQQEDAQLFSFLQTINLRGGGDQPFGVEVVKDDPPDRLLRTGSGRTWALELTEITVGQIRTQADRARKFGVLLLEGLAAKADDYPHLIDRRVAVSYLPAYAGKFKKDLGLTSEILNDLRTDRGFFVERSGNTGPEGSDGPGSGIYGRRGPFSVSVYERGLVPGGLSVVADSQKEITQAEVIDLFNGKLQEKDASGKNELVLVTFAAPDENGFISTADSLMYELARQSHETGSLLTFSPENLRGIAVQTWDQPLWFEAYGNEATLPWRPVGGGDSYAG